MDIKVGDKLVTSGIDGVYPAGLAVATVSAILQNPESPFAKIVSTPVAEVNNHLQLLLLELPEPKENETPAPVAAIDQKLVADSKPSDRKKDQQKNKLNAVKNKAKANAPH